MSAGIWSAKFQEYLLRPWARTCGPDGNGHDVAYLKVKTVQMNLIC